MNKRLRKKRLKAKWNVKKIPKWIPFAMYDECMTKMKTRLEESLDNTLLFGEQILNGMPLWSPVQLIYGQGNPLSIRVTGKCIITDCLEPWRLGCTGCPFYERMEIDG